MSISTETPTNDGLPIRLLREPVEGLAQRLIDLHPAFRAREHALSEAAAKFQAAFPNGIDNNETLDRVKLLADQIAAFLKKLDTRRLELKGPLDAAGKEIQIAFTKALPGTLERQRQTLTDAMTAYLREMERRAREAAAAEAKRAQQEALDRAAAAAAAKSNEDLMAALDAEDAALKAEGAARNAKPAEFSRVQTTHGRAVSLAGRWTVVVDDITAVPKEWLVQEVDTKRALAARTLNEKIAIPGLHFDYVTTAR
jgi:hypothetical protein